MFIQRFVLVQAAFVVVIEAHLIGPISRADTVLYDPALGTIPSQQGWLSFLDNSTVEQFDGHYISLDTTADRTDQSGYFSEDPPFGIIGHPQFPVLDRNAGFTIRFELQVISESHNLRDHNGDGRLDRAGFSVIAISDDLLGVELGFFEDRLWVYAAAGESPNSQFTQAEGVTFDTTADFVTYDLSVFGDHYTLYADHRRFLSGPLRNYNPTGLSSLVDPYDNPSFVFLGDDTTSAESHTILGRIEAFATGLGLADVNRDGWIDAEDIDALSQAVSDLQSGSAFDMNRDGVVDGADRSYWISQLQKTWIGDSNLDGEFNSTDLVAVFESGEYEDVIERNSSWSTGDWNGDREFDSSDLVAAFQEDGYERGPRATTQSVPEPRPFAILCIPWFGHRHRRGAK